MTVDALQALTNERIEDRYKMANLPRINLPLYQGLTQAQEKSLVISKHLQALKSQKNTKKPETEKPAMEKNTRDNNSKSY